MACFRPIQAWRSPGGSIVFGAEREDHRAVTLPCGRCIGCRQVRVRSWAIRCLCEAQMHPVSSFVTLTYGGEIGPSLVYKDFQRFMYRLRRRLGPTRFFMCGEYGELNVRPHFHALLFGRSFSDGVLCRKDLYTSKTLSGLWPHGFSSFGAVTYQSAAYVASYTFKKRSGPLAREAYERVDVRTGEVVRVVPEFGHMSLKPGIGYSWFVKFWREVYGVRDGIVKGGGAVVPSPRYFDKLLERDDPLLRESKEYERYVRSAAFLDDSSPGRLLVREQCAVAAVKQKVRRL